MPQVVLKNISREKAVELAPSIANAVAHTIRVPLDYIVVEHSETEAGKGITIPLWHGSIGKSARQKCRSRLRTHSLNF